MMQIIFLFFYIAFIIHSRTSITAIIIDTETAPSQTLYKYFNSLCRSGTIPPTLIFDSNSAATDAEKATLFNNYFHSVFTQSSVTIPPLVSLPTPNLTLCDISISELDVFSALSSLNSTKAMGIDGIYWSKTLCISTVQTHPSSLHSKYLATVCATGLAPTLDHTYSQVWRQIICKEL